MKSQNIESICDVPFVNKIIQGDNLELISKIPDNSIDLIITSPPYFHQRDYGAGVGNEEHMDDYINNIMDLFEQCVRVIGPDGSIVFNIGDKIIDGNLLLIPYRFAIKAQSVKKVKLVNHITWVKLNPTPRQFQKRLVQSTEPFFHFVKSDDYYFDSKSFMSMRNKRKNKPGSEIGKKYYQLINGSNLTSAQKSLAIKELDQVRREVRDGKISSFRMKIHGLHSMPFGGQEGGRLTQLLTKGFTIIKINGDNIKRDVIECPVESIKWRNHPAIYPQQIIMELIGLLTKPNDLVLDPYLGSGTTAVASKVLGRKYIGFEINSEYCKQARKRVSEIKDQKLEWFI